MKRTLLTLLAALALLPALADEGMWLPSLISERIDDMRAKGFRLTAEDIYSINKASMKDAVVLFNGMRVQIPLSYHTFPAGQGRSAALPSLPGACIMG